MRRLNDFSPAERAWYQPPTSSLISRTEVIEALEQTMAALIASNYRLDLSDRLIEQVSWTLQDNNL